jgi:hypothetical protein
MVMAILFMRFLLSFPTSFIDSGRIALVGFLPLIKVEIVLQSGNKDTYVNTSINSVYEYISAY